MSHGGRERQCQQEAPGDQGDRELGVRRRQRAEQGRAGDGEHGRDGSAQPRTDAEGTAGASQRLRQQSRGQQRDRGEVGGQARRHRHGERHRRRRRLGPAHRRVGDRPAERAGGGHRPDRACLVGDSDPCMARNRAREQSTHDAEVREQRPRDRGDAAQARGGEGDGDQRHEQDQRYPAVGVGVPERVEQLPDRHLHRPHGRPDPEHGERRGHRLPVGPEQRGGERRGRRAQDHARGYGRQGHQPQGVQERGTYVVPVLVHLREGRERHLADRLGDGVVGQLRLTERHCVEAELRWDRALGRPPGSPRSGPGRWPGPARGSRARCAGCPSPLCGRTPGAPGRARAPAARRR